MRIKSSSVSMNKDNLFHLNRHNRSSSLRKDQPLRGKIDEMLSKDYLDWRQKQYNFDVLNSQTTKNNEFVKQYIHKIYVDYNIQDPLYGGETVMYQKNNNLHFSPSQNYTPTFNIRDQTGRNLNQQRYFTDNVNKDTYITPIKQRPISSQHVVFEQPTYGLGSKVKFIEKTAHSQASSFINSRQNIELSSFRRSFLNENQDSRMFKSGVSTREQIINPQKYLNVKQPYQTQRYYGRHSQKQPSYRQHSYQLIQSRHSIPASINQHIMTDQKHKNDLYASTIMQSLQHHKQQLKLPIKQSYRYCVGCQNAILQANVRYHQTTCSQFQKIFNLSTTQQIIHQINTKISNIISHIQQKQSKISYNDSTQLLKSSRALIQESYKQKHAQKSDNFIKEYVKAIDVGKKWGLLTQKINKLKWFVMIKENLQGIKNEGN